MTLLFILVVWYAYSVNIVQNEVIIVQISNNLFVINCTCLVHLKCDYKLCVVIDITECF